MISILQNMNGLVFLGINLPSVLTMEVLVKAHLS